MEFGDNMNMFPWGDSAGQEASGGEDPNGHDPIVQNPKGTGELSGAIEPTRGEEGRVMHGSDSPQSPSYVPSRPVTVHNHAGSPMELLRSVLRYKWSILVILIFISAPLIAIVWTQVIPVYQARAEIRVRPIIPRLVFRTDENGTIPFYDSFVNTQVSIIRSLTVLNRVLEQEDVQQTQWYQDPARSLRQKVLGGKVPPVERLRNALSVRPRSRTEIIDVSFSDASAADAKVIVNAVLDQYLTYVGEKSIASDDLIYRELTDRKKSLEDVISGREEVLARLQKSLGTALPEKLISAKRVYLDGLRARLSELQQTISILEWEIEQRQGYPEGEEMPAILTGEVQRRRLYHEDSEWLSLDRAVRTLEHQIANTAYGPNHPELTRLKNDKAFAEEELVRREAQLDEQWKNRALTSASVPIIVNDPNRPMYADGPGSLEHQLARAEYQEKGLLEELGKRQKEFEEAFSTAQMLNVETSHLGHERELYDAVRTRLDQKNMERNVPGSIDVLMRAFSPSQPASDRRGVFTAMVLCLGLGVGGGVAFLRATRNQTIHASEEMSLLSHVPFLGTVPLVRIRKVAGRSLCDELGQNQFRLLESVRVLRTALLSRLDGRSGVTVLVTSADEGTGKSSFTMMLGKSIAQAGRKVLIVDSDFHKMSLSKRFDLLDEEGFIESLKSKGARQVPVQPTKTPGLDILPAGHRSNGDPVYEEIANGAFKACVKRLRQDYNYDVILFDSSPLLPVADSAILAGQVDGTIMVERENLSHRSHVVSALARLDSTGGRLLGTVFVGSGGSQDYGRGYSYSYGYGHSTRKTAES